MRQKRRKFSREFKSEAVRLVIEKVRSISQVARDLDGIGPLEEGV